MNFPALDFCLCLLRILGPSWSNRARLTEEMMSALIELPGTKGMAELRSRADALATWKLALQRGTLPRVEDVEWPQDPFKAKFMDALRTLEMPRFTRRYPAVLNTLMKQMLTLVQDFEEKLAEAQAQQAAADDQEQQQDGSSSQQQQQPGGKPEQNEDGEGQPGSEGTENQESDDAQMKEAMEDAMEQSGEGKQQSGQGQQGRKLQMTLEGMKGEAGDSQAENKEVAAKMEKVADEIVKSFEAQMGAAMENLERGEMAFDDLNALMDSAGGFDLSRGTWRRSGWKELDKLRKVLEDCPELRELVRQLGRGGGKGPLRRAPEEVEARGSPAGVIRSPLQPEEVRGLTRSDSLSRMLPSEMALLAHGWPRKSASNPVAAAAAAAAAASRAGGSSSGPSPWRLPDRRPSYDDSSDSDDDGGGVGVRKNTLSASFDEEVYYLPGAHAARMLHRVRRAERMLMSYELTGWLEHDSARVTSRTEIRPAAELGPIILCLDTSGSMQGAREVVAKALALECLRGAHRQRRACYLYAFSGPDEVQELELGVDVESLDKLLDFLSCSFSGGTDVDKPLALALKRLESQNEWAQADILMVTDGEIPDPSDDIVDQIRSANKEFALEVHGLMVSSNVSKAMNKLCTHIHVFKSWTSVGGKENQY
ncbi:MAG: hypothetical protein WDW38_003056 [Sanguina aurantia]